MELGSNEKIVLEVLGQKRDWVSRDDVIDEMSKRMRPHEVYMALIRLGNEGLIRHDYSRFKSVGLVHRITRLGEEEIRKETVGCCSGISCGGSVGVR